MNSYEHATGSFLESKARWVKLVLDSIVFAAQRDVVGLGECSNYSIISKKEKEKWDTGRERTWFEREYEFRVLQTLLVVPEQSHHRPSANFLDARDRPS